MLDQKTPDHPWNVRDPAASKALEYAGMGRDERSERWMIALRVGSRSFPPGKKRLTKAWAGFRMAEKCAVPQGTERQRCAARHAITECGKALAGGP